jgi:DNA polymerase
VSRRLAILAEMGLAPVWRLRRPQRPAVQAIEPHTAADSREQEIRSLEWPQLRARVSGCTDCRLRAGCRQTVFGVGDERASWMLVGEAPGADEDRLGEPFVGQAGKLLDNMLRALGLARGRDVYIANVIKCRPPGNRDPQPDEVAKCSPYLERQIALVRPKLILAMGRFAAQTLLQTESAIARLRGTVHHHAGVPLVVTYHPAYLLRNLPDKAKAWADLRFAARTVAQK